MNRPLVTRVVPTPASADHVRTGLIAWLQVDLEDSLRLDGIALRATADGRMVLSYPERRDGGGRRHSYIRPLNDDARRDFERQVLAHLGIPKEVPA